MKEILLIGDGGHSKSVIDVIEQEGKFKIAGIVGTTKTIGSDVLGYVSVSDPIRNGGIFMSSLGKS